MLSTNKRQPLLKIVVGHARCGEREVLFVALLIIELIFYLEFESLKQQGEKYQQNEI